MAEQEVEADIPQKPLPNEVAVSGGKAVEVQPCASSVIEESCYSQEEPAPAGSSYSSSTGPDDSRYPESQEGRQTRSQTGSLPVPTRMSMAEEMNSKTHMK